MKKSIKLKHGDKLGALLGRPEELTVMVKVAFTTDEETGYSLEKFSTKEEKAISNLILSGLLSRDSKGVRLKDKSVVDMTLRKKPREKHDLDKKKLSEVQKQEVPKDLQKPYEIAKSFRDLFKSNLETLGMRTNNIQNATFEKWVTPIRLMFDNDGVTMEQFREVWKYLNNHKFWADKVQSTQKLRDKFETIHGQIKGDERRKKDSRDSKNTGNVSAEYASQVLRDLQSD